MNNQLKFQVAIVRAGGQLTTYTAIGTDAASVLMSAVDRFGVCAITVKPTPRATQ